MTILLIIIIAAAAGLAVYASFRQRNRKRLESFRAGESEILMHWKYSPEDWEWYAGDTASRWIKHRDVPGEVFVTPESIYVTNGRDEHLFFFGDEHRITQCSFFHSFLDLRAETRFSYDGTLLEGYERQEGTFRHEDFRLYIPRAQQEKGLELAAKFKSLTEANSAYAQKFVEGDEIIPLFGSSEYPEKRVADNDDEIISLFGSDDNRLSK